VDDASLQLDHEQHVVPAEQHSVDMEEVGADDALGHLADRCFPFAGHGDNVTMELGGKGFWHGAHPSCE
jgi:hypothetical protein